MTALWRERREIGDAVMFLGDSLEVLGSLADDSVDLVFTDPPYGHNNNNNGDLIHRWEVALGRGQLQAPRQIQNDGPEAESIVVAMFAQLPRILGAGCCCCCCCGGGGPDPMFARWSLELGKVLSFKQMVIWDKGPMGLGWHYRRSYETVLVAEKPGAPCRWFDTTERVENIIRPGAYGIKKIIPCADDHPTPKPVELAQHFIGLHSRVGETVLDPFMGAGSTAEAALRNGRRFIGIEIDEKWFSVACQRAEQAQRQHRLML